MESDKLLIEPVWNRNMPIVKTLLKKCLTFNRTSMESKRGIMLQAHADNPGLLIEPVWNRNRLCACLDILFSTLLIEPVWNRNLLAYALGVASVVTFNRTSMESKLAVIARAVSCVIHF